MTKVSPVTRILSLTDKKEKSLEEKVIEVGDIILIDNPIETGNISPPVLVSSVALVVSVSENVRSGESRKGFLIYTSSGELKRMSI